MFQGREVGVEWLIVMGMKTNRIPRGTYATLAVLGAAMMFPANAEKVRFEELPSDVRDRIKIHSGSAAIEDVDRQTKGGQTTYEVAFKKNGQHTELMFDEKGQLRTPGGAAGLESGKIQYTELPEGVRRVADARLKGAEVNDVDRQVRNGRATYEIGFKQNGQQQELVLSEDGRIVSDAEVPAGAIGAPAPGTSGSASIVRGRLAQPVMLSGSEKVQINQAPAAVQKAITTAANGARVEDLERGTWEGRNIYQAGFKENGRHVEVQVRENGTILHDPRQTGTRVGQGTAPGRVTWGKAAPEYAAVTSLVPLSSSEKVERTSLPGMVQRRLTTQVGSRIDDIERGTWQGKTIYQVGFKDADGKHQEMQIDDAGKVVFDPRAQP